VVAAAISGISATFFGVAQAENKSYSLWTSPGMIVTYVLVAAAVALIWLGATNRPFPPWREIPFPYLDIEVRGINYNRKDPTGAVWVGYRLAITNHEPGQTASLAIAYRGKVASGQLRNINPKGEDWGETPFVDPKGTPPPDFPNANDWFPDTLNVRPQHTETGYYVVKLDSWWVEAMTKPTDDSLLIVDRISTRAIYVPARLVKGSYNPSNWLFPTKDADGFWTVYPTIDDENSGDGIPSS
jgi:hypothetical protein